MSEVHGGDTRTSRISWYQEIPPTSVSSRPSGGKDHKDEEMRGNPEDLDDHRVSTMDGFVYEPINVGERSLEAKNGDILYRVRSTFEIGREILWPVEQRCVRPGSTRGD